MVTGIFSGTELENYLREAPAPDEALSIVVNRYAHDCFPHDLTFVRNLLAQYRSYRYFQDEEKLLWEPWTESPDLRNRLFELLSSSGRLDAQTGDAAAAGSGDRQSGLDHVGAEQSGSGAILRGVVPVAIAL